MRKLLILAVPIIILLSGCAKTMNENQCLVTDWRTIGYEDGSAGRNEQMLERRREACAEFGIAPDMDQYLMGRAQGLQSFCQPARGFDIGLRGSRYENVCPPGPFLDAYQDGRGIRDRRALLDELEHAVASAHSELRALDEDIANNTLALATAQDMTNQERISYALDLKNMAEDRGRIQASLPQLEADLEAARYDLDAFSASISQKYPGSF